MKKTRKLFIALLAMATLVLAVCGFAACNNTPNDDDKVLATVITLDQSEATLKVGETLQLNAVVDFKATDKSVEWKSSDTSKATVSNEGLVTAVAAGTSDITVTTKDGSNLSKPVRLRSKKRLPSNVSSISFLIPHSPPKSLRQPGQLLSMMTERSLQISS